MVAMDNSDFLAFQNEFDLEGLVSKAKEHISFLKVAHEAFVVHTKETPELITIAFNRYVRCWLPLLKEAIARGVTAEDLVVPVDVAYVWHVHRLHPYSYLNFIEHKVHMEDIDQGNQNRRQMNLRSIYSDMELSKTANQRQLNAVSILARIEQFEELCFKVDSQLEDGNFTKAHVKTKELWEGMFPNEPYMLDLEKVNTGFVVSSLLNEQELGFTKVPVGKSGLSQRDFVWKMAGPAYKDDKYLQIAAGDYLKFLNMIKHSSGDFSVPRMDIDLFWHTHMTTSPLSYAIDCINFVGKIVNHDDSEEENGQGSRLDIEFKNTGIRWMEMYGLQYVNEAYECKFDVEMDMPEEFWQQKQVKQLLAEGPVGYGHQLGKCKRKCTGGCDDAGAAKCKKKCKKKCSGGGCSNCGGCSTCGGGGDNGAKFQIATCQKCSGGGCGLCSSCGNNGAKFQIATCKKCSGGECGLCSSCGNNGAKFQEAKCKKKCSGGGCGACGDDAAGFSAI